MNREELINQIRLRGYNPNEAREVVDFVIVNFKPNQSELEAVKAERDELKAFVRDFYEIQKDNYGNATNTHLKMIDLAGNAEKLLKDK